MELRHEKPCALWVLTFPYGSQTFFFPQRTILFLTEVAFYFSQKNTEKQNTQHSTETLSQPITQSVTAIFSWNVLWYLYAGGLLWARNVRKRILLNLWVLWEKEIPFVREGTPQRLSWLLSHPEGAFYFSQKYTDEQNTQHSTETLSQPITQNVTANTYQPPPIFN